MRRLTFVFAHVLPAVAVLGLLITDRAMAQTTPAPSLPAIVAPVPATPPPDNLPPSIQRGVSPAIAPPVLPPGRAQGRQGQPGQQGQQGQQGQGQQGQQPGRSLGTQPPQAITPPASAPRPETPRAPFIGGPNIQPMPSATNIRLDLTITDTFTGTPVKKAVSLIVLTANNGMIRTTSSDGWAILNVDAIAAAYSSGQVSVRMTFEYTPALPKDTATGGRAPRLNESITVVLQDGKPLMVSQSADPSTDRKVTTELTATILK